MEVPLKDLQIYVKYRIKFNDCCVNGEIESAMFLGWNEPLSGEDDDWTYHDAKFDFGQISGWSWFAYEVK